MFLSQLSLLKLFQKTKNESNGSSNLHIKTESETVHPYNPKKEANRNRLYFSLFLTVVIVIFCILTIHGVFIEHRLSKLTKKLYRVQNQHTLLEKKLNEIFKGANKGDQLMQCMTSSEADEIKFNPDSGPNPSSSNSALISNTIKTNSIDKPNADDNINESNHSYNTTVIKSLRSKRSAKGKRKPSKKRNRSLPPIVNSTIRKERVMAYLPLIHLENNSSSFREKQSEVGASFSFWKEPSWVTRKIKQNNFRHDANTGNVTIEEGGVYLVYLQVVYHDAIGRWSAGIVVNGEVKAKCLESEQLKDIENYFPDKHGVYKQCSLTTVVHVQAKQRVSIKCMYGQRTILSQPEFTYWGMVKLA